MHNTLIAGIDPGTTTAIVLLDQHGRIVMRSAKKNLGLADLLAETYSYGKIVAVGTDKAKTPSLVKQFARSIGARTITPHLDLTRNEKKIMNQHVSISNAHEWDAHASAILALRTIKPLLDKITHFLTEKNETHLLADIAHIVLRTQTHIHGAYAQLNTPPPADGRAAENKTPHDTARITQRANQYKEQTRILSRTVIELRQQLRIERERNRRLDNTLRKLKPRNKKRETDINTRLYQRLSEHDKRLDAIEHERQALRDHLYTLNDSVIVQHVPNLAKRITPKSQYLYVDTPNEVSIATLDTLKGTATTILCNKLPKEHICRALASRNIDLIADVQVRETHGISHVRRAELDHARNSKERLLRIFKEHQSRFSASH